MVSTGRRLPLKIKSFRYKLYFWRRRNSAPPPEMHECYPPFALVREQLGQLFVAWKQKRDYYGSAFVLYVASRRGFQLYTENRFINFIWAMESCHRTKYSADAGPSNLDREIQRILEQIAKPKDRKWLSGKLQRAEIGLKERITQVIMALPLELEKGRCEQLGDECGRRRNDLSHYGGRRDNSTAYAEFHEDLARKSDALSYLLHVLILQELGIAADILHRFVYQSLRSIRIKHAFVAVGLLDKTVLEPSPAAIMAAKAGFLALQKSPPSPKENVRLSIKRLCLHPLQLTDRNATRVPNIPCHSPAAFNKFVARLHPRLEFCAHRRD
jgi:hypothetical protein